MIDIHSHILPLVDDGSTSVDMSLEMLDEAYRDGTKEIVLTPHLAYAYGFENPNYKIKELFGQFKDIVEDVGIPIKMYLGCEFLYRSHESFERHFEDITTLNDTKYLLMEFYFDVEEEVILEAVQDVLDKGYIPVVAHPERFEAIQKNKRINSSEIAILDDVAKINEMGINELIEVANSLYRAHNYSLAVEKIWDAFERMKTYYGKDKKVSANKIIDKLSNGDSVYKELFEEEFNELTRIGNAHCIRHHEKGKIPIENELQYKYFYLRCYALISVVMDLLK